MTRAKEVLEVMESLSSSGVSAWLFGGWAVEAQVSGAERPHSDVDLVVLACDLDRARDVIEALGFTGRPDPSDPCEHLRFGRSRNAAVVQVASARVGRTFWWLSVTGGPTARDRWLPCPLDGFPVAPRGALLGSPVRCATPEVLLQSKLSWQSNRQNDARDADHLRGALSHEQVQRAKRNRDPIDRCSCDADCAAIGE